MSPTAVYTSHIGTYPPVSAPGLAKGPGLVIGSPSTAQDGKYQSLVSQLGESRRVDKQLLERLVDRGVYKKFSLLCTWRI
jgi:hypothetical protein